MRDAIRLQHLVQMTMQTSVPPNQLNMIDKMSLPSIYCRSFTLFIFASLGLVDAFFSLSHGREAKTYANEMEFVAKTKEKRNSSVNFCTKLRFFCVVCSQWKLS